MLGFLISSKNGLVIFTQILQLLTWSVFAVIPLCEGTTKAVNIKLFDL